MAFNLGGGQSKSKSKSETESGATSEDISGGLGTVDEALQRGLYYGLEINPALLQNIVDNAKYARQLTRKGLGQRKAMVHRKAATRLGSLRRGSESIQNAMLGVGNQAYQPRGSALPMPDYSYLKETKSPKFDIEQPVIPGLEDIPQNLQKLAEENVEAERNLQIDTTVENLVESGIREKVASRIGDAIRDGYLPEDFSRADFDEMGGREGVFAHIRRAQAKEKRTQSQDQTTYNTDGIYFNIGG